MEQRHFCLEVEGFTLAGQVYLPDEASCSALCLCHGIPRGTPDATDRGYPALAERLCEAGFLTVIFNFRGTGASGGNFDILGWTRDLEAVLGYIRDMGEAQRQSLALMGFSAGAAVSVYVAARDPRVSLLVSCACPSRFQAVADADRAQDIIKHFREVGIIRDPDFPPSVDEWLGGFRRLDPLGNIARISPRPVLIVHGSDDDVVHPQDAVMLHREAGMPKGILMVEGAGHRLRLSEKAMNGALDWLTARLKEH
ncbi:MAG: alpha/beta fold hydrolase [Chloroflexota bacterium]|nr:alpha/beta fold hydrolase [Chloroflexota bacterium]